MGSCSSCCRSCRQHSERRILVVGLDGAGKTTFLYQFKKDSINDIAPTVGFNCETVEYDKYTLHFWDIGGEQRMRGLWVHHYSGSQGVLFVVDINQVERFGEVKQVLDTMLKNIHLEGIPIAILANKAESHPETNIKTLVSLLNLDSIKKTRPCELFQTVAKTGEGIEDAMQWICKEMKPL
ncbi:hypothetical protein WA158_006016 [Blastocystis sp. Blastoise]